MAGVTVKLQNNTNGEKATVEERERERESRKLKFLCQKLDTMMESTEAGDPPAALNSSSGNSDKDDADNDDGKGIVEGSSNDISSSSAYAEGAGTDGATNSETDEPTGSESKEPSTTPVLDDEKVSDGDEKANEGIDHLASAKPVEEEIVFEEVVMSDEDDEEMIEIEVGDDDDDDDEAGGSGEDDYRSNDANDFNSEDLYSIEEEGQMADDTEKGGEGGDGDGDGDSDGYDESVKEGTLIADVINPSKKEDDDDEDKLFDELALRNSKKLATPTYDDTSGGDRNEGDVETPPPSTPATIPVCHVHKKPCRVLTANSKLNKGRKFYKCALPPHQECDFFQWADGLPTDKRRNRALSSSSSSPRGGGSGTPAATTRTITTTTTTTRTTTSPRAAPPKRNNKGAGLFYLMLLFLCLLVAGIAVAMYLFYADDDDDSKTPTRSPSLSTGGTTPFDPIQNDCDLSGLRHPHVIDQCRCSGEIETVADDVQLRYDMHVFNFAPSVYAEFNDDKTSCSVRNQALVWLSTANDNEFDAQERRQRFALATVFISLHGEEWNDSGRWLSSSPSCEWGGVVCDSQNVLQKLSIDSNLAGGTVSIQLDSFA